MILDEPPARVDPAVSRQIGDLVLKLRERGIDVIILDHHEPNSGEHPPAAALVNPKFGDGFHDLCSAGIVFSRLSTLSFSMPGTSHSQRSSLTWLSAKIGTVTVTPSFGSPGSCR